MKFIWLGAVVAFIVPTSILGQQLSSVEKTLADAARAKYYNLEAAGFQSLTCSVKFDFSTVPLLPSASDDPTRMLLQRTSFILVLDGKGRPSVEHHFPDGATEEAKQRASQVTNLLTSFVMGLFQTWPSKGLEGPIPPFDSQIEHVAKTDQGYTFSLRVPGAPVEVTTDKNYMATEIVSLGGKVKEHPVYAPSPEGLVFAGNDALDESHPGSQVEVRYELGSAMVDGLRVPSSARLRVNQNIDVRFALDQCSVKRATVLHVAPPQK